MSEKTILVIDDSATIRRLVDNELGSAGYRVVMAANAEDGIMMAMDEMPDMILLDHQLPGTTGYEVCCQLMEDPELQQIPIVVSSTLRKKAYAEYTEQPNVIDMLPKPYTPELLRTTVANALDTAAMVVASQSSGTAVPEVIDELPDGELSGSFSCFKLREVLDFLNNASKRGMLEIDLGRSRVAVFLSGGRIQAVTASGIDPELVSQRLPQTIADLAPMVKFTMRGRNCSEVDGLVELLDNKVLDARLLKQLLRHQAAVLIQHCMENELKGFRFVSTQNPSVLFGKLPLDISLLALTVEAALAAEPQPEVDPQGPPSTYVRQSQRGQNLDRAGLAAQHMKLLNTLSAPCTIDELAQKTEIPLGELRCVLQGFVRADVVVRQAKHNLRTVIAITDDIARTQHLNDLFKAHADQLSGKVVRDVLAVRLLLRRVRPDLLLFDLDGEKARQTLATLTSEDPVELRQSRWCGIAGDSSDLGTSGGKRLEHFGQWPEGTDQLADLLLGTDADSFENSPAAEIQMANCN